MQNRVKTIIVTTDNGHGVLDTHHVNVNDLLCHNYIDGQWIWSADRTLECIYQTYFNVVKVEFIMECD